MNGHSTSTDNTLRRRCTCDGFSPHVIAIVILSSCPTCNTIRRLDVRCKTLLPDPMAPTRKVTPVSGEKKRFYPSITRIPHRIYPLIYSTYLKVNAPRVHHTTIDQKLKELFTQAANGDGPNTVKTIMPRIHRKPEKWVYLTANSRDLSPSPVTDCLHSLPGSILTAAAFSSPIRT